MPSYLRASRRSILTASEETKGFVLFFVVLCSLYLGGLSCNISELIILMGTFLDHYLQTWTF